MSRSVCHYISRLLLIFFILPSFGWANSEIDNIAFFYAKNPPVNELSSFNHLVVEDAALNDRNRKTLLSNNNAIYAYVSLGEYEAWRQPNRHLPDGLIKAKNQVWNSSVVDVSHPYWTQYVLEHRIKQLVDKGYDGIFLDTLDSYQLFAKNAKQKAIMQQALVKIIESVHERYPSLKILVNRGFEIIDDIAPYIDGVIVESVFHTWDDKKKKYRNVKKSDTKYLLNILNKIKKDHQLPIVVIDYVSSNHRDKAQNIAKKITTHGFTPWVSVPTLDYLGIGTQRIEPRKLLMLYNTKDYNATIDEQAIFKFLGVVADYYGYTAEYHDISQGLPKSRLAGEYAGVVTWFEGSYQGDEYKNWFLQQIDQNIRFAILGSLGFGLDLYLSRSLSLKSLGTVQYKELRLVKSDNHVGFEYQESLLPKRNFFGYRLEKCQGCQSHLQFKGRKAGIVDAVITTPWGGWAQGGWLIDYMPNKQKRWILEPFAFINKALQLDKLPAPDVTTHYGRRILLTHIDGDGFLNLAQMPGTPYSSSVILDEVLKKYKIPHTVSVIEGEIGAEGLYPKKHKELEGIAREIFALPHIEPASHTYSHPFKWRQLEFHQNDEGKYYHLPIKQYTFDYDRDIKGSMDYVDTLLPPGMKAQVLLWSGDALPEADALEVVEENNFYNLNGGNTIIRDAMDSYAYVTPMSRKVGPYLQIYAPIMNENVYTNDWLGPFYGFRDVIQTLEKTDTPRRLKPMNIYYHFYSGEKFSALNALIEVYDWALNQEYNALYISDYVKKVDEFERIIFTRDLNDTLSIHHANEIRSFRTRDKNPSVMSKETGVIGYRDLHDGRYLHTNGQDKIIIEHTSKAAARKYLVQTNGHVEQWDEEEKNITFRLTGHEQIILDVKENTKCRMKTNVQFRKRKVKDNVFRYKFYAKDTGLVSLKCR